MVLFGLSITVQVSRIATVFKKPSYVLGDFNFSFYNLDFILDLHFIPKFFDFKTIQNPLFLKKLPFVPLFLKGVTKTYNKISTKNHLSKIKFCAIYYFISKISYYNKVIIYKKNINLNKKLIYVIMYFTLKVISK